MIPSAAPPLHAALPLAPELARFGLRARIVAGVNGLDMHVLEAGFETASRPLVLLLHGFPELAWSWRNVMPALAAAGYHVVAPDQRGYGGTTGWDGRYDGDVASFRLLNLVVDMVALLEALGARAAAAVIGHDFGSPVAAWCAIARPDLFRAVALLSAPFAGSRPEPSRTAVLEELASLPRPRKHYQWHYATREAEAEMLRCPQGFHDFLRAYFHIKSADWPANAPFQLAAWSAAELARLPAYYIMDRDRGMAETVAPAMPDAAHIAGCRWLSDDELAVYAAEFARTGLQGGLNWYRCRTEGRNRDLALFAGRTIDVPACFIAGERDWGTHQTPGALTRMQREACTRFLGVHLVPGAGHWVQQEQPEETARLLLEFLRHARETRI